MADFLPPVVVTLLMNNAEFLASADESKLAMGELAATSETTAAKIDAASSATTARASAATGLYANGVKKLTTAVVGAGVAFVAFGVDKAIKLQDALDQLKNQTNVTSAQLDQIKTATVSLSNATGQSAINIVGSWKAAENAGYKFAQAQSAVTAATKLTVIAGGDLVTNTQSLIAAQQLGITKGFGAAKTADLLTTALKGNEQGLAGVVQLLQGKVGASFAAYNQSAGEAVSLANILSLAQYSNTRALSTFVNKIGEFNTAMITTSVSNGKVRATTAGWVNSLLSAGLNVDKVKTAFTGPEGLVNGLKYLQTVSHGSLTSLNQDLQAVFGATGVGLGELIIKHLPQLAATTTAANKASGAGLNTAFVTATHQFGTELSIVWQRFVNTAAGFGLALIPSLQRALDFISNGLTALQKSPKERAAIEISLGAAFAAAIGLKLEGLLNKSVQTTLLAEIAANTAATAGEGGAAAIGTRVGVASIAGVVIPLALAAAVAYIARGPIVNSVNSISHKFFGTTGNSSQLQQKYDAAIAQAGGDKTDIRALNISFQKIERDFGFLINEIGPGAQNAGKKPGKVVINVGFHK